MLCYVSPHQLDHMIIFSTDLQVFVDYGQTLGEVFSFYCLRMLTLQFMNQRFFLFAHLLVLQQLLLGFMQFRGIYLKRAGWDTYYFFYVPMRDHL